LAEAAVKIEKAIDWQILQLNIVATRHVIGRVVGVLIHENFGGKGSFFESTHAIFAQSTNKIRR
jgi:hypothetical protein